MANLPARLAVVSVVAAACCIEAGSLSAHQSAATAIDVRAIGPAIGARVPDFKLVDQEGRDRSLESVMGRGGVVLVFFRSADW
jgi:cytochrome oxidase Cu insertion factor (SCO1/SenC/PrrC family)